MEKFSSISQKEMYEVNGGEILTTLLAAFITGVAISIAIALKDYLPKI